MSGGMSSYVRHLLALTWLGCCGAMATAQTPPTPPRPDFEDLDKFVADAKRLEGVFPMYLKKERLYLEVGAGQFEKPYLFLIAIARGIGADPILGGYTLGGGGDDWLIAFRRVGDRMFILRKNVRFKAAPGTPLNEAVKAGFNDSVLASLRIVAARGQGSFLIDFSDFLFTDLGDLASVLRGTLGGFYLLDGNRTTLGKVKNFPLNAEIQVNATYGTNQTRSLDTVPDARGVTITVHYSLSALPETGYRPRLADDRIGYFYTAVRDYSQPVNESNFVRYIHRWHLEKADPKAEKSPPKQPVIFYIEKTVPYEYRSFVRSGILEWNKAFEKAGFLDAIEVRQQPDDADWDPEDVRYNTFRWITSSAGYAMGPSRVNPLTGQIFDADIIFDADMVRFWRAEWDRHGARHQVNELLQMLETPALNQAWNTRRHPADCRCDLRHGRRHDLAFGALAVLDRHSTAARIPDELIGQAIKETTMHEVGHTLGLRHNFKASTMLRADELHDTTKTRAKGISASVMDYNPVNLAAKGAKQGDYYSDTIGPYDYWAIEYGYRPFPGGTDGEKAELAKIAGRSGEKELAYATDEDTMFILSPDPFSNRFDLGSDVLEFARQRLDLAETLLKGKLMEKFAEPGKGYQQLRRMFGVVLNEYRMALLLTARHVGGSEFTRSYKGDANAKPPFTVVTPKQQREALALLKRHAFTDAAFQFPPELLNSLAPDRWLHWGMPDDSRPDYPIHDEVRDLQSLGLRLLLSPLVISRVLDNERKSSDSDVLTLPEVFREVTEAIWSELNDKDAKPGTNREPAITSFRRNLQRVHLNRLIDLALRPAPSVPEDARALAWMQLRRLGQLLEETLKARDGKLDDYSRAHCEEARMRIVKALDAAFQKQ